METNTYYINKATGELTYNHNKALNWNELEKAEVNVYENGEYLYTWMVMG